MFSKYILILSALFSFSVMQAQADMSGEEASGFNGAFEIRYNQDSGDKYIRNVYHRIKLGWAGEVSDMLKWKIAFGTGLIPFKEYADPYLIESYVAYAPLDGLKIKVGNFEWKNSIEYSGVLYEENNEYFSGVDVNYQHDMMYAKVNFLKFSLGRDQTGDFYGNDLLTMAEVGVKSADIGIGSVMAHIGAHSGSLLDNDSNSKTLVNAGLQVKVKDIIPIPVSLVGQYVRNLDEKELSDFSKDTYTAALNVHCKHLRASVLYYNINKDSWNNNFLNTNYAKVDFDDNDDAQGVAVKLSREVWDNSELEIQFGYDLDSENSNPYKLAAEMTFKL